MAMQWWDNASVYQVYPRSFFDSDQDGIGDLNGISAKIDYLKDLGIDAIWISWTLHGSATLTTVLGLARSRTWACLFAISVALGWTTTEVACG